VYFTVIVPTRNEERMLGATLATLLRQEGEFEVLVVDGGSSDGTLPVVERWAGLFRSRGRKLRCLVEAPGRARQMNCGARSARGEVLLFLHADTWLPDGALGAVRAQLNDPRTVGGGFAHRFQEPGLRLCWISFYSTLRGAWRRSFCGDQALFVRRDLFLAMGGFRDMPLMEDLDLTRRLRRQGRVGFVRLPVRTSARRFHETGILFSLFLIGAAKIFYGFGRVPSFLVRRYGEVR
jgi:rSAM/selenodomain-associated transferase 2